MQHFLLRGHKQLLHDESCLHLQCVMWCSISKVKVFLWFECDKIKVKPLGKITDLKKLQQDCNSQCSFFTAGPKVGHSFKERTELTSNIFNVFY